jgi:drug/metabolite transporter (DMT)-like permease
VGFSGACARASFESACEMTLPAAKLDGAPNIRCWTWFHRVSFLVTGILTTIINQIIFYNGVGDPSTGFLSLPTYLGMLSVIVVPTSRTPSAVPQYRVVGSASIDVCSQVLCMLGLQVVGSGVFQVLYSAVVCFTALLSTCILGKSHSALQWVGILAIACGLGLTSKDSVPGHPEHGTTFVVGIFVTLMGCVGYACSYVCNEVRFSLHGRPYRGCVFLTAACKRYAPNRAFYLQTAGAPSCRSGCACSSDCTARCCTLCTLPSSSSPTGRPK